MLEDACRLLPHAGQSYVLALKGPANSDAEICLLTPTSGLGVSKGPHTRTVLPSVLTAQFECVLKIPLVCAVKISGLCNFRNGRRYLTAQFTVACSVCCVLKAKAQFVYIFPAHITSHGYLVEGFSSRVY